MSRDVEHDTTDCGHEHADEWLGQAGHHLLEMFVALCAAPDDPAVADRANVALHELEVLLAAH